MDNPKVSIIILNWNGWKDTIECLESVYQINYSNYDIILVDNHSKDKSIRQIKNYAEGKIKVKSKFFDYNSKNKPIKIIEYSKEESLKTDEPQSKDLNSCTKLILIKNEKNYGFAEGNNIGMRYALKNLNPTYILLLNNDTVVDKEFLGELSNTGEIDKNIGVMGPKICYYNKPNKLWSVGRKIEWWSGYLGFINSKFVKEVDWVSGCALFIRSSLIKKIGLLDSKLFFGWEDIDYCIRTTRSGLKVIYNPNSVIKHKISKSREKLYKNKLLTHYNRIKNRFFFLKVLRKYSLLYQSISQFIIFFLVYLPLIGLIMPLYSSFSKILK
ncbi:glycosyltransferase family 2 protein [Methanobacterium paludis]|uniref:Glycosyl transferase family 2 n=1 Tax=Methanobacterium paludis (strain DSM 25820 / JCM 18151 / SWAN1) TaxID=868131 RepID=F6D8A2_METPW|nr:glycosyltransferase family 2 protein [Methanobacterium paludis]AEG18536.1 glycosyl transferase family 2 [Methanobacterium paludis]